jgi:hypothetical protein
MHCLLYVCIANGSLEVPYRESERGKVAAVFSCWQAGMIFLLRHRWPPAFYLSAPARPRSCAHPRLFSSTPHAQVKKRMPPKKAAAPEKKAILGRPSNNLKIGIVGACATHEI